MKTFDPAKMTLQGFEDAVCALMEFATNSKEAVELIYEKFSPVPDMETKVIDDHSFLLVFHASFLDGEDEFQIIFSSFEEREKEYSERDEEEVPPGYHLERGRLYRLH